jgi:hypothetical protein
MACLPHRLPELARTVGRSIGSLSSAVAHGRADAIPLWSVIAAALTPLVLTSGWFVAGLLQPASYSPLRETVSVMAGQDGTDRWVMTATLIAVGGCYLVTATGLTVLRLPARLMLVVAGLCSLGIAASPEPSTGPTAEHIAWTAIGGVTIAVWPALTAQPGERQTFLLTARGRMIATVAFVVMLCWVVVETQGGSDLGLAERLMSSVQTTWPFVVALLLRRGYVSQYSAAPLQHRSPSAAGISPNPRAGPDLRWHVPRQGHEAASEIARPHTDP